MLSDRRMREFAAKTVGTTCEDCGGTRNLEVHHRDENPQNNDPTNLQTLCRRCHYWTHNPPKVCEVPWCQTKRRKYGYCEKHAQRFKKWGDPLLYKPNQHTPVLRESAPSTPAQTDPATQPAVMP